MPFAQFHYPFENIDTFEENYPGDFISEYVGQVRAWFYYVHAVNVGLFGKNAYKNVIVTGNLAGNDGRKMSKSYGNYTDPNVLMDEYSADALRFLLLQSPLLNSEDFALQDKEVSDVARKLAMIWNMYDFFTMYAEVDGWEWDGKLDDPSNQCHNILDQWIISRTHQLIQEVEEHMDRYDIPNALAPIMPFLEDASNWYVRRSRKRFWKSGNDQDKNDAYRTLHYVLVRLSMVLAPFTPFLAEELYQKLTNGESVHLLDWPEAGHVNELVLERMKFVREVINEGLSQRAAAGVKVRQPLQSVTITGAPKVLDIEEDQARYAFVDILTEELNVKQAWINFHDVPRKVALDLEINPELRSEGMMREVIRFVQNARKKAGLNVDDRIKLSLQTSDETLSKAIQEHLETIKSETLATSFDIAATYSFEESVKVDGTDLELSLQKL
jgi:isoleucyl-tRNA synthetase